MLHEKKISWAYTEHDHRVTVESVANPTPTRPCSIFTHSERGDIADAATIEISGCSMMDGVCVSPEVVGGQRQYPDHTTDPIVSLAPGKEGAMAAIVLNHKQPHEEARSRHGKQHGNPIPKIQCCPDQQPQYDQRYDRDPDLNNTASIAGSPVASENARPCMRVQHRFSGARELLVVFQSSGFLFGFRGSPSITWRAAHQRIGCTFV